MFRSTTPGYMPWHLNADEAIFLTMALTNATDIASRVACGELALYSERYPSLILTRVFRGGAWQDQWEPFMPPRPPAPIPDYPHSDRLQQLALSKPSGTSGWELDVFYLPTPVQEERGERPYFPTMVLIVDRDSSFLLSTEVLGARPSTSELQDVLVGLLKATSVLPYGVVVDSASTADLVESITKSLGIALSVGVTPALDEAKGSLMTFIER